MFHKDRIIFIERTYVEYAGLCSIATFGITYCRIIYISGIFCGTAVHWEDETEWIKVSPGGVLELIYSSYKKEYNSYKIAGGVQNCLNVCLNEF